MKTLIGSILVRCSYDELPGNLPPSRDRLGFITLTGSGSGCQQQKPASCHCKVLESRGYTAGHSRDRGRLRRCPLHPFSFLLNYGRKGQPEEISGAVLWLCSDAASFMTGKEMAIGGGHGIKP